MRVSIDISIFSPDQSAGHVTGQLELLAFPRVGEVVSLLHDGPSLPPPGFEHLLKVTDVIHAIAPAPPSICLEDIEMPSMGEAIAVMRYLESNLGLFAHPHGDVEV